MTDAGTTSKKRKPRGRKKPRKIENISGTQEVYVHCTYNCGRTYRTMRYPLDKKAWHKTLRKLNAHESQRCPLRSAARSPKSRAKSPQKRNTNTTSNVWDAQDGDQFWKSPIHDRERESFFDFDDGRKRHAVTDNKKAQHQNQNDRGPSYNRLIEARERLKSLEQNMSTLRHSAQMSKARFASEKASLLEENKKLEKACSDLLKRAEEISVCIQKGAQLPPKDIWEHRMKMTDEHPDDFVEMAKRIEQAKTLKNNELKRIQNAQAQLASESQIQREFRQSQTVQVIEQERRRRLQDDKNLSARRLSQRVQTLKLQEHVPMQY